MNEKEHEMGENGREVAVILGVSGGAGGAVARALARDPGLDIFGVHRGRMQDEADKVEADVRAARRECRMLVAPAGKPEEVTSGAEELLKTAGPRSVKVFLHAIADASYGAFTPHPRGMLRPHQFAKTFDSMAHSFVWWVQELVARDLLADGARLIAMSNSMVDSVVPGWGLIAAAKMALEIFVRHLAHELGPGGHRVMLLKFGLVETRATRIAFTEEEWQRIKGAMASCTPARRIATLEEVGAFVSVLAGPTGEWFNGSTIDFTGGQVSGLLDTIVNAKVRT